MRAKNDRVVAIERLHGQLFDEGETDVILGIGSYRQCQMRSCLDSKLLPEGQIGQRPKANCHLVGAGQSLR
jgi:hypothetical protein